MTGDWKRLAEERQARIDAAVAEIAALTQERNEWRDRFRCSTGKVPYLTSKVAQVALQKAKVRHPDAVTLNVYFCPHCELYHLGNRNPTARKATRPIDAQAPAPAEEQE